MCPTPEISGSWELLDTPPLTPPDVPRQGLLGGSSSSGKTPSPELCLSSGPFEAVPGHVPRFSRWLLASGSFLGKGKVWPGHCGQTPCPNPACDSDEPPCLLLPLFPRPGSAFAARPLPCVPDAQPRTKAWVQLSRGSSVPAGPRLRAGSGARPGGPSLLH